MHSGSRSLGQMLEFSIGKMDEINTVPTVRCNATQCGGFRAEMKTVAKMKLNADVTVQNRNALHFTSLRCHVLYRIRV